MEINYKFFINYVNYANEYLYINMKDSLYNQKSILISKNLPFLNWRIKRVKNKMIKIEEICKTNFVDKI